MPRVMISYRNVDGQREFAQKMEQALSSVGLETWMDIKDIPRLSRWEDEIFKGIIDSDYVLLCMSPEYFESEMCLLECQVAQGYGKKLLPILVPHPDIISLVNVAPNYEETRGLERLNYLNFAWEHVLGLPENNAAMIQRVIDSILKPQPIDSAYDVYFSFKFEYAEFATRVADDLNSAGISTFIHTRSIDVGIDWRQASWGAALRAQFHAVVLSPEVATSEYIAKEVLVSRTKETTFIPILAEQFTQDSEAKATIRDSFANDKNLALLNQIQWFVVAPDYENFIADLVEAINELLER